MQLSTTASTLSAQEVGHEVGAPPTHAEGVGQQDEVRLLIAVEYSAEVVQEIFGTQPYGLVGHCARNGAEQQSLPRASHGELVSTLQGKHEFEYSWQYEPAVQSE